MRVRAIIVAGSAVTTALAVATLVAGCGGGSVTASAPRPAAPTTAATRATPPRSTTGRPAGGGAAPVTASLFRADLTVQRPGLGLLALTNTARRPVTVRGWPTLEFLDAASRTVAVPVREVAVPGAGPSITIGPGETAFAGVRWTVGVKADPKTFVATTLRLAPPGGAGWATVNVIGPDGAEDGYPEFDLTSAEIGTLQPSSQGVLVF